MQSLDLEALRDIFKDRRSHIAIGQIKKLSLVNDRSSLKCLVSIWPEENEIVTRMTWEMVGPESGIFSFPSVDDLVLVAFADGDYNQAFIIRRLTSKHDKIPLRAKDGDMVFKAMPGKKAWMTANKVYLTQDDSAPTENLVLGQQLKSFLVDLLSEISSLCSHLATHTHTGNLGFPTSAPIQATQYITHKANIDSLKVSPVQTEEILSSFAFTKKGL